MWLQRFILLVKDEMYFWGTTNHKAEICSPGNKKSFPPVYSASEEAAHRKRYRGCGLPGGSHAICPRHNRLQFPARVRPGAGGKPMYWSHNIQGSTASSWRKYFFKILERKEKKSPVCLTNMSWLDRCLLLPGKTFLLLDPFFRTLPSSRRWVSVIKIGLKSGLYFLCNDLTGQKGVRVQASLSALMF